MNADDVLARHLILRRPTFGDCCVLCGQPWGVDGCDAVVMAREVKRLREALATHWSDDGTLHGNATNRKGCLWCGARAALGAGGEKA